MRVYLQTFRAVLIAAGIIVSIETAVRWLAPAPPLAASNFLELAFLKAEGAKLIFLKRLQWGIELNPDIVQVGDSSGLHGTMPFEIDKHLGGLKYVNGSFGADVGYIGHNNAARILAAHTSVKAVVFYVTPSAKPAFYGNRGQQLAQNLDSSFLSPWHYLSPPSLGFRLGAANLAYYGDINNQVPYGGLSFLGSQDARGSFFSTKGFIARESAFHVRDPLPLGVCPFANWFEPTADGQLPLDFFYSGLEQIALMAREKKIRLMVVFNPVPCRENKDVRTLTIERELARFRQNFPEVVMPFPFITTWPEERFMDSWHFFGFGAKIMSNVLGPKIHQMMTDQSYRGVEARTVQEIDAELALARNRVDRPEACAKETQVTQPGGRFTNCLGMTFAAIPAGKFVMGSCPPSAECPAGAIADIQSRSEEQPAHPVTISAPFQLSETPVTIAQFTTFLNNSEALVDREETDLLAIRPEYLAANQGDGRLPVTMVSWTDAQAFAQWLNRVKHPSDKGFYRLPSEAEWEYAARGGSQQPYWWGTDPGANLANCIGCSDRFKGKIAPVASFPPNPFGLYDMNGNIWQWTADCYRSWYSARRTDGKPYEKPDCMFRSLRGGSADYPAPAWSRTTARILNNATSRSTTIGFRVVREFPARN